ncbi:S-adenosyl-L-methionine-dependent methyltransferase [Lecanosticta acicola]|uniref:S-adenosyl-L-methionine-dependent methyltransferase n=1 Tax=Lecanosticta acicola TaxID=111012 RepID=A0AAI8VUX1_9PEZI|nr:S-adenosyl-L-methionine-dependent methyltransferase [Lecanosticta acicola]
MSRVPITSLLAPDTPSVERFTLHGRTYCKFQDEVYNFPADDTEFERLDIMHHLIYLVALNKQLHLATLRSSPRRILDVGFGTGFWMFDIEKMYPSAEVIGIDLENQIGANPGRTGCIFKAPVDFNSSPWPIEDASVDLVHMAQLCGCVADWQQQYGKAYRCLRPGTGQIEHVEVDWTPRTHESHYPAAAIDVHNWWYWMCQASSQSGKPMAYREDTEDLLEHAGFVDVAHKRIRVPLFVHSARKDQREWALAHGYQVAMGHEETESFTGLSMLLFTRYLNFSPAQVLEVCNRVKGVIGQKDLPLYINLHVWTARRPQS